MFDYLSRRQRAPVPFPTDPRRGLAPGGHPTLLKRRTTGAQLAQLDGDPRYPGDTQDGAIRRDRTPWYPTDQRSGVGTAEVDWTAAGPPRPELHMRNVTVRTMAGTSQTRAFADPRDPSVGMHSATPMKPSVGIERYKAGAAAMRPGRTDRLSPARYSGQTYSQTTVLQGATSRSGGRRAR